ncbi:AAA family ATPase [Xanthobacter sp. TB0136]|uniref:AAA family ATPase n=1 Tax=Xanthobacter sp. TB0136 TaxID=3459177 RepID=UPI0040398002
MQPDGSRFVVITGGPGSGKSSLVAHLSRMGYAHAPEGGRAIIRAHMAMDGPALPWRDRQLFAELMLMWDIRSHEAHQIRGSGLVFFDRGVPDVLGYLALCGLEAPAHLRRACDLYRYSPTVFVAPPWPEIYRSDSERKQDWDEARRTCDMMCKTYEACGYNLVTLPKCPVEDRAAFVLEELARN